jgi:hypothetical protein
MTDDEPKTERYTRGTEVVNYVVYKSTKGIGKDEVLQHKLLGTTETAHITLHPDGTVNFREERGRIHLENIVKTDMQGFTPPPSSKLREFLRIVRQKIDLKR